jgi:hypothetical protein
MSKAKRRTRKPEPHTLTVRRSESPIEAMATIFMERVAANAATMVPGVGTPAGGDRPDRMHGGAVPRDFEGDGVE